MRELQWFKAELQPPPHVAGEDQPSPKTNVLHAVPSEPTITPQFGVRRAVVDAARGGGREDGVWNFDWAIRLRHGYA